VKSINFGIIGCGDVTEKKSGPAFKKINGCRLVSVMRRDPEKLLDYARRHGVEKHSTNYMDLLTDSEINAIYIATPPGMHCYYTLEAARHKKDVYVEKPMAISVQECREMMQACQEHGVRLFVAYYRRGQEKFRRIKALLEEGTIGKVLSFQYTYACPPPAVNPARTWLLDKKQAGGGLLYDIGSHMVDTLRFLLGDVEAASGLSANVGGSHDVNDVTSAYLRFKSGIQGTLQMSFHAAENLDEAVVFGSQGSLRFSIMDMLPITLKRDGIDELIAFEPLMHVQMPYIEHVIHVLQGFQSDDTTGANGLITQQILEAFETSETIRFLS